MTNIVALWIGGSIVALLIVDALVLGWGIPLALGREFIGLIDWLAFWR